MLRQGLLVIHRHAVRANMRNNCKSFYRIRVKATSTITCDHYYFLFCLSQGLLEQPECNSCTMARPNRLSYRRRIVTFPKKLIDALSEFHIFRLFTKSQLLQNESCFIIKYCYNSP